MLRTGWSDAELATARPDTVALMRHALYAEALKGAVALDIDDALSEMADAKIVEPKAAEKRRQDKIRARILTLTAFRKVQRNIRSLLLLDDPESVPDEAPS